MTGLIPVDCIICTWNRSKRAPHMKRWLAGPIRLVTKRLNDGRVFSPLPEIAPCIKSSVAPKGAWLRGCRPCWAGAARRGVRGALVPHDGSQARGGVIDVRRHARRHDGEVVLRPV